MRITRTLCWSFLTLTLIGYNNTNGEPGETGGESVAVTAPPPKRDVDQNGPSQSVANTRFDFEDIGLGQVPAGWQVDATRPANEFAQWSVRTDPEALSENHVLSVQIADYNRGTYNLLWTHQVQFQDGAIQLRVRAGTGEVDQAGGPIWRVRDQNNYYIARWNPLENNFRLYFVKDGKRVQLGNADVDVSALQWHTIRIEQDRNRITGFLDGKKLLEITDSTFPQGGGVGFWTKADADSFFDDLVVERRETR